MKISLKLRKIDEELTFKSFDVKVTSEKKFQTPIKTSNPDYKISEINEIYKNFDKKSIHNALRNEKIERRYDSEIKRNLSDGINLVILNYKSKEVPTTKEIEFLADLQYSRSDIVITPSFSSIIREKTGDELLKTFLDLTNEYINVIETLNSKTIVGIIPSRIPRIYIQDIVKNYHEKGISSFIIDMDSRGLDSNMPWIRNLWRNLMEYDFVENTFIYSINANKGKFMKEKTSILAKDFMNLGFGIDVIGENHVPLRIPTKQWMEIKSKRRENTFRIFNKDTYAYQRITEAQASKIQINNRRDMKHYNIKEQYFESSFLKTEIRKNDSIAPYISQKELVDEKFMKKLKNFRKKTFTR